MNSSAPQAAADGLSLEDLAERIERSLLMRAREGLSNSAAEFLRDLSVLPEPAPMGLLEAKGEHLGDVSPLLGELQERFLVERQRALRQVHPLVREVELPRLARDPEASGAAHRRAGAWHAAALSHAVDQRNDAAITTALGGVRHHFAAAGARDELVAALDVARPYVQRKFHWTVPPSSTEAERDAQIGLHLALHEAFCWLAADEPHDAQRALDRFPARLACRHRESDTWVSALIALRTDDLALGHERAKTYLGGPLPRDATAIERALIREWDTRVATLGEPNPARYCAEFCALAW